MTRLRAKRALRSSKSCSQYCTVPQFPCFTKSNEPWPQYHTAPQFSSKLIFKRGWWDEQWVASTLKAGSGWWKCSQKRQRRLLKSDFLGFIQFSQKRNSRDKGSCFGWSNTRPRILDTARSIVGFQGAQKHGLKRCPKVGKNGSRPTPQI